MSDATHGPDNLTGITPDTGLKIGKSDKDGPMLAADGTPLKTSLNRALRRQKRRALMLIAPLLLFILLTFIYPIGEMLFRSVENQIVGDTLPRTVRVLADWNPDETEVPGPAVFSALAKDMTVASEEKNHTRLGSRLNYEVSGISSLFRKTGRNVDDIGENYTEQFVALDPAWEDPQTFVDIFAGPRWVEANAAYDGEGRRPTFRLAEGVGEVLPQTASIYRDFARVVQVEDDDNPAEEEPWNSVYLALYEDLRDGAAIPADFPHAALLTAAQAAVPNFATTNLQAAFVDMDKDWTDREVWRTIQTYSAPYTTGYFLNAADLQLTPDGIAWRPENERVYITLFVRTLIMSTAITVACILLGYPIGWLLANLPSRQANLLMILVLLPFWTSLLVRTSAWKVLLQDQGVINDLLVWIGFVSDGNRLALINNATGTIIAMTHILLPFMILPLYSVMKTIPPSYLRAAKSLGATNWTAFWRVYFPQSVPGIGAGSILVFILAIGYYITPEIVGGTKGVFISNRIAYHISTSLNWGLAAALGAILLVIVMAFYWAYDRIVGIDNVKLGG
ncbi:putative spermidine/putrescine transport system permease protein [Loktanella atrilutea]|uniref:Putative spermidine/putrescine transport system permease protein n=1 Tax=Loktanella atrilutea TaxID=366533 RepID=A0A1M5ANP0_LOKAT|nr:ABC transporter permease [Loktanella atrilutea]SHF31869.1 putative spermidine/putrescine transport system permease protein [Loktanella atrilutea]